jgi:integrase
VSDQAPKDTARQLTTAELRQFVGDTLAGGAAVRRKLVEPMLFLEVRPATQAASWVFRYTFAGKKTSQGFGKWPGVGLKEAREKASVARVLLSQGISPVESKRVNLEAERQRQVRTVGAAVAEWLASDAKKLTSPKYAAQKARRLDEVLTFTHKGRKVHALGQMPVTTVTTENVTDSLSVLVDRGTHETARRVLGDLEKAFDWARGKGWRAEANPCSGVGVILEHPEKKGHRAPALGDLGEVVRGLRAVQQADTFDYDTRLARLLLLTAARNVEVRQARWDEVIDLDGKAPRIEVPASRMKKRKDWTIALSTQAVEILKELRANSAQWGDKASPLVFFKYGRDGRGKPCHENTANLVLSRAGLHDKVVAHGFRKLFSTAAYSLWPYRGNNRERAIEHSLAHVNSQTVEQTYNKSEFLDERRMLAQWWADHLDHVADGKVSNVVEFKQVSAG